MKIIISILILFLSLEISARQYLSPENDDQRSGFYNLNYCSDHFFTGIGSGKSDFLKAAIQIPVETANRFKGSKLTKLRIALDATGFSNTRIFLSYTKEEKPFYTQMVTFTGNKTWDEIVLDTPYELEGKEFFIGYSLVSRVGTEPLLIDDRPINPLGGWVAMANVWYQMSEIHKIGNLSIIGVLEGDNLPINDLSLEYAHAKPYLCPGESVEIKSRIKNKATETIRHFKVTYQIGQDVPVDTLFTDVAIPYNGLFDFSFHAVAHQQGKQQLKVSVSLPNGKDDEDCSNNEWKDSVNCRRDFIQRKVVVEHFATRVLNETIGVIDNLDGAISTRNHINRVVHFAGYATDEEFQLPVSVAYTWFYNQGIYANGIMIDRADLSAYKVIPNLPFVEGSPVFSGRIGAWYWGEESKAFLGRIVDGQLKETPALVRVDISKLYDNKPRKLKLSVSVTKLDMEEFGKLGDNLRLNVFLLEDEIRTDQSSSGGSIYYRYNNVLRKVLSETWGDEFSFSGNSFSKEYECILPMKWDDKNTKILAFVSNYNSKDRLDCEIYNSETLSVTGELLSDVKQENNYQTSVFSRGAEVTIEGEFNTVKVYGILGNLVKTVHPDQATFKLADGLYLIKIDHHVVRKIRVSKW